MPDDNALDENVWDELAFGVKVIGSLIPVVGGPLVELITRKIPNQRAERVVTYLRFLEERIASIESERRTHDLRDPERVDLIEEGAFQSARATSTERIERIANLVANGLETGEANLVRRKRLAKLLGEIDDDELAILNAHGQSYGTGDWSVWDKVNRPEPAHMQSTLAEIDADKLYQAGEKHLLRLGLLQKIYTTVRRGEMPEFDARKGDYKHRVEISYLGRMLLRAVGQPSPFDEKD